MAQFFEKKLSKWAEKSKYQIFTKIWGCEFTLEQIDWILRKYIGRVFHKEFWYWGGGQFGQFQSIMGEIVLNATRGNLVIQ